MLNALARSTAKTVLNELLLLSPSSILPFLHSQDPLRKWSALGLLDAPTLDIDTSSSIPGSDECARICQIAARFFKTPKRRLG
jgi:hypothetical protein